MATGSEGNVDAGSAADLLGGGAGDGQGSAQAGNEGAQGDGSQGGAGDGQGGGSAGTAEWQAGLSGDPFKEGASHRDYAATKGWKDHNDIVQSYRELETSMRNGNRIAVPGENASAEERAAFHRAIGVPEDVAGYAIEAPTGADGQPVPLNTALMDRLAGKALEAGMPAAAFKSVVSDFVQAQIEEMAGLEAQRQAEANAWVKQQGANGDEALAAINRAATILGLSRTDLIGMRNVMGADKAMGMLSRIGFGAREDTFGGEGRTSFGLSGTEAKAQLATLRANPAWAKAAMQKGTPENLQYTRLSKMMEDAADREAAA